jgi:hydrogenase maturation protease
MKNALVEKLARALLYEGYILYPYRPSVKNQQRWTFGGVYPPAWSAAQEGADPQAMPLLCKSKCVFCIWWTERSAN